MLSGQKILKTMFLIDFNRIKHVTRLARPGSKWNDNDGIFRTYIGQKSAELCPLCA
jgi:hypothetical protein